MANQLRSPTHIGSLKLSDGSIDDTLYVNDIPLKGESSIDLSDYVQKTTTIAGVDLQDNITASELKIALSLDNVANVESSATPVENGTDNFTTGGAYTELNKKINTSTIDQAFFDSLY